MHTATTRAGIVQQAHLRQKTDQCVYHVSKTQTLMSTVNVRVTLVGRDRAPSAQPVCLENTSLLLVLLHALIVHPTLSLQTAASQKPPVNVTLDTREKMEQHARNAVSTNTKKVWGMLIALLVLRALFLWLAASQKSPVSVTLGIREKMEQHARSALSINTKLAWGLLIALLVLQTLFLQQSASRSPPASVMPGSRERTLNV